MPPLSVPAPGRFCPSEEAREILKRAAEQRYQRIMNGQDPLKDVKPLQLKQEFELFVCRPDDMGTPEYDEFPWQTEMYTASGKPRLFRLALDPIAVFCRASETVNGLFPGVDDRCEDIEAQISDTKELFNTMPRDKRKLKALLSDLLGYSISDEEVEAYSFRAD